jgi:hypothetical protein
LTQLSTADAVAVEIKERVLAERSPRDPERGANRQQQ